MNPKEFPCKDECCYTCADYSGDKSGWSDIRSKCSSEEIIKVVGKPFELYGSGHLTMFTGCRFWRKQHSIATLAKCTITQLGEEKK